MSVVSLESASFGVSEFTTWPLPFEQDLALYRECGVDAIELCEFKLADGAAGEDQLWQLKDSGLTLASVQPRLHSLFPDAPRPLPADPRERMAHVEATMRRIGNYFPGATMVSITGAAPHADFAAAYRTAVLEYGRLAQIAEDCGVRLAVEPLNPILMNVDTFLCTLGQAGRLVDEVDHPAFGLLVDVWHVWEDAGAPALLNRYGAKIFGVHINDWKTPRAFGDRHLPGDGEIPLVPLLQAIRAAGYDGTYTLEIFSQDHLEGSLWRDPRRTVREGRRRFDELWKQVCA